jgi:hypothetical protein
MVQARADFEVPKLLARQAASLLDRALNAAAERFEASPIAFERRLAASDTHAWNAFQASLALDVARYLAAIDPLIEEVYLCVSPEPAGRQLVLAARVRRETPALALVAQALDHELCEHLRARGLAPAERLLDLHVVAGRGAEASGAIVVVNERRSVPVRIWKREPHRSDDQRSAVLPPRGTAAPTGATRIRASSTGAPSR